MVLHMLLADKAVVQVTCVCHADGYVGEKNNSIGLELLLDAQEMGHKRAPLEVSTVCSTPHMFLQEAI